MIARASRKLLPRARILGGDGLLSPRLIRLAGKAAEGLIALTPWHYDASRSSVRAKAFHAAFMRAYKTEPDTWAALAYDAVGMAIEVIRAVGPDREKIRAWLANRTTPAQGYLGVTGNTWFDAEGDCRKPPMFVQVAGGRFGLAPVQLVSVEDK